MTAEPNFAAEVEAEDLAVRRAAVDSLLPLWELKQAERFFKRDIGKLDPSASDRGAMGPLRLWLTEHAEEGPLYDNEAGVRAFLRPGGTTEVYDLPSAIQARTPETYARLAELGCFVLDPAKVKDAVAKGLLMRDDIEPWVHRIEKTPSLIIEKVGEA